VHLLNSKYIACELMYKINMFLPRSYFVYRSVFLLIVCITIILLKQVFLSKIYILFLDIDAS